MKWNGSPSSCQAGLCVACLPGVGRRRHESRSVHSKWPTQRGSLSSGETEGWNDKLTEEGRERFQVWNDKITEEVTERFQVWNKKVTEEGREGFQVWNDKISKEGRERFQVCMHINVVVCKVACRSNWNEAEKMNQEKFLFKRYPT